jgi:pimeloyl-ACP methyl ester carboxylesterase
MSSYVLVHGAWGGGWSWRAIADRLEEAGHKALIIALKGLGTRVTEIGPEITLTDHINDVVDQVSDAGIERFILVGHSYGGMVITGVATKLGAQIDAMIYIDAFLPDDGNSLWDITGAWEHDHYINSQKFTPGLVAPIMGAGSPKLSAHPLLTLLEAVQFTGEEAKIASHTYVFATGWEPTPFRPFAKRVQNDPAWRYHEVRSGHDVMADQPDQLFSILIGA